MPPVPEDSAGEGASEAWVGREKWSGGGHIGASVTADAAGGMSSSSLWGSRWLTALSSESANRRLFRRRCENMDLDKKLSP